MDEKDDAAAREAGERVLRGISHDLMQPLGAIKNYAELIRQQSDGDVERFAKEIAAIATKLAERVRAGLSTGT